MDNFIKLCNDERERHEWLTQIYRVHRKTKMNMKLHEILEWVNNFIRMGVDPGVGGHILHLIADEYHND